MDHTVLPAINTVSVHQMAPPPIEVANIIIAAHYSFIDPERMKG